MAVGELKSGLAYLISQYTGLFPSQTFRKWVYRRVLGMSIGDSSVIYGGCEIRGGSKIKIGKNTSVGHRCILDGRAGLTIGDSVNISTGVWVWTMQHDMNDPWFKSEGNPVHIEDYAWVSGRAIILPGLTIGKGAVIASGAVVTKSVLPYSVMAGVPAKKIGEREKDLRYKLGSCMPFA
jgi:acetyltransferase-like isoleucine patch superfamily enzyme